MQSQLQLLSDHLSSPIAANTSTSSQYVLPQSVAADGNPTYPYAAENSINNLSNITITNANLSASEIPALDYLSLSGGTLTGTLNVPTLSASTTNYGVITATNASSTLLSNFSTAYFGGTATSTFDSAGDLTVAGNTSLQNATSTNLFSSTSSSTNLYATNADVGSLSAEVLNLVSPLAVTSGGTGWGAIGSGSILFGNGSSALATSSNLFWDNVNGRLGVGTTTPGSMFSVQGVANFSVATSTFYGSLNVVGKINGNVLFAQNGTGAVQRTISSKLQEQVSVLDYGAKCDGTTNDSTAFQNAIATGKDVYVPDGVSCVIGDVTITGSQQVLYSDGATLIPAAGASTLITLSGYGNEVSGFNINDNGNLVSQTLIAGGASASSTNITISNATGVQVNQRYSIQLNNGSWATGWIEGVSGTTVTLSDPLPSNASNGNTFWSTFGLIRVVNAVYWNVNSLVINNAWGAILLDDPSPTTYDGVSKGTLDRVNIIGGRMFGLVKGRNVSDNSFSQIINFGGYYKTQTATGDGVTTTFNLNNQVFLTRELTVVVNGVTQTDGTNYTIATNGMSVTFTTAPPSGAAISFGWQVYGADGYVDDGRNTVSDTGGNQLSDSEFLQYRRCANLIGAQNYKLSDDYFDTCSEEAVLLNGTTGSGELDGTLIGWAPIGLYAINDAAGVSLESVTDTTMAASYPVSGVAEMPIDITSGSDVSGRVLNNGGYTDYAGGNVALDVNSSGDISFGTTTKSNEWSWAGTQGILSINSLGTVLSFSKQGYNYVAADGANSQLVLQASGANGIIQADASSTFEATIAGNNMLTVNSLGVGVGTTTPGSLLSLGGIANFTTSTSTFYSSGGINLASGCFAIAGNCISLSSLSGTLGIVGGGTNQSTQTTNGVNYFDGTHITSSNALTFNGTALGAPVFNTTQTSGTSTVALGQGFSIGGSQFVVQQGSGNVGVGTASPGAQFQVTGSSGSIQLSSNGTQINFTNNGYNYLTAAGSSATLRVQASGASGALSFLSGTYIDLTTGSSLDAMRVTAGGNVGIGTTTPYSKLAVWGPDTASTSAFQVSNNASTTEFNVFDNGNATLAGTLTQNSDQRLKTDIQSLDASSSLSLIDQLNPVTFDWIDPSKGTTPQLGFIAQQVLPIFPNLISTTSPTALTPDGTLSLNYIGLISPIISAIQALSSEIASIENAIEGFATIFHTQELCVGSTCIDQQQLAAILAAANAAQTSGRGGDAASDSDATTATDTAPVIQINGDNPALVQVGDTYNDLGATITGPTADLNLGITTYVNGIETSPVQIDTSAAATDTIDYVATDQNGLTSTSTRTVIIEASTSIVPTDDASTTTT